MTRKTQWLVGVTLTLGFAWLVWPYWSAINAYQAANTGDPQALETYFDWERLREGFASDLRRIRGVTLASQRKQGTHVDRVRAAIGGLAASRGIGPMLDYYTEPSVIAQLVNRGTALPDLGGPARSHEDTDLTFTHVRSAFFSGDPFTFLIELNSTENEAEGGGPVYVVMAFHDFGWRVTRIALPVHGESVSI